MVVFHSPLMTAASAYLSKTMSLLTDFCQRLLRLPYLERIRLIVLFLFLSLFAGMVTPAQAQTNNAQFISQTVPTSMIAGQSYQISVTMTNNGTTTWNSAGSYGGYKLGIPNSANANWGINRVLLGTTTVAPGQSQTFTLNLTAPKTTGTYHFQWQMVQENVAWFGAPTTNVSVNVVNSQTITFNPLSAQTMGTSPFALSATASSGLAVAFTSATPTVCTVSGATVTLVAAGTCTINANQGGNTSYGSAPTVSQSFTISARAATPINNAQFVSQTVPTSMIAGQSYQIPVTMINNGTTTWNSAGSYGGYKLGIPNSANANWGINRVLLGTTTVAPGQSQTFTLNITAPKTAGTYNFQWQMVQENVAWFGALTTNVSVNVLNSQTITFNPLSAQNMGASPFALSAMASSSLPVTFTSATSTTCTVSGATVTLVAAGTCTINANQTGNTSYAAAAQVTQSFTVSAAQSFIYIYDPAGQLLQMVGSTGFNNQFTTDAVGNIGAVGSNAASAISISQFAPASGPVGTTVTLNGTGFDLNPANNVVRFNGTAAIVSSSTATALTVLVPATATSGTISVANGNGSVTSSTPFTVAPAFAAGSNPTSVNLAANQTASFNFNGVLGQGLTLVFSGFSSAGANVAVTVTQPDGSALLTSACTVAGDTDCTLPYLPANGSYKVTMTAGSTAVQLNMALVADLSVNLNMGAAAATTAIGADQAVTYTFSATAGQAAWVDLFGDSMVGSSVVQVYGPNWAFMQSTTISPANNLPGSGLLTLGVLPSTGIYHVRVIHPLRAGGTLSVQATTGTPMYVNSTGSTAAINLALGQTAIYTFAGTAGQPFNIAAVATTSAPYVGGLNVSVVQPDGTTFKQLTASLGQSYPALANQLTLPQSGTYVVYVTGGNNLATGTLYLSSDVMVSVTPNAQPVMMSIAETGQAGEFTFNAAANQSVTLLFSNNNLPIVVISVYDPSGNLLSSIKSYAGLQPTISLPNLSVMGLYTVQVVPFATGATGNIALQVVTQNIQSIVPGATPTPVSLNAGQTIYYTYTTDVTPGTMYGYVALTGVPASAGAVLTVTAPDDSILGTFNVTGPQFVAQLPMITLNGTYVIKLTANSGAFNGNISFFYDYLLSLNNPRSLWMTNSIPAAFMFNGTAGQNLNLFVAAIPAATNSGMVIPYVVLAPDGSTLASYTATSNAGVTYSFSGANGVSCVNGASGLNGSSGCLLALPTLPASGTYSVQFYPPAGLSLGGTTIGVGGPNLVGALALGSSYSNVNLSEEQNAQYTFSASEGQYLTLGIDAAWVSVTQPDGTILETSSLPYDSGNRADYALHLPHLTQTGTYSVLIGDPPYVTNIGDDGNVVGISLVSDQQASLTYGGAAQTLNFNLGAATIYTFSGTAGTTATLGFSATIASGATFIPDFEYGVYEQNGTQLTSGIISINTPTIALGTLPATGTYTVRIFGVSGTTSPFPLISAGSTTVSLSH